MVSNVSLTLSCTFGCQNTKEFSMKTKIFHNPKCGKSRNALNAFNQAGFELEIVYYLKNELKMEDLKEILQKSGLSVRDIVRKKEKLYVDRELDKVNNDEIMILEILNNPILLERPIVLNHSISMVVRDDKSIKKAMEIMKY